MLKRFAKLLPALIIGLNVIVFVPMTLWIFISDGGAFGFGYLALPLSGLMNLGGISAIIQIVRKSNRRSYAIINGIFGLAGIMLMFLLFIQWWTAVLEKISTMG